MILSLGLSEQEEAQWKRAHDEEFGGGRKRGSLSRFAFLAHHYGGEKQLESVGQLELFRRTQRLPDYQRAEDAVRRGWGRWIELELGISADEANDPLKVAQFVLLYGLRHAKSREARQQLLASSPIACGFSAGRGDDTFFISLGHVLDDPPPAQAAERDFTQVLLHNWLAGFWWLMPLNAVAHDIARIQGKPEDEKTIAGLYQRLRKIQSRRAESCPGAFFSGGWNGVFYSSQPPLIDCIEKAGRPLLNATGRRLLLPPTGAV